MFFLSKLKYIKKYNNLKKKKVFVELQF